MAEEERNDTPREPEAEQPEPAGTEAAAPEPVEPEGAPAEEQPASAPPGEPEGIAEGPPAGAGEPEPEPAPPEPPAPEASEGEPTAEGDEEPRERPRRPRRPRTDDESAEEEVIPGAHLEPDLVLEEQTQPEEGVIGELAEAELAAVEEALAEEEQAEPVEEEPEPAPAPRQPLDLAADARYRATGKRKSAVARVILRPGGGSYQINGRHLDEFFPRIKLQKMAKQPLEAAGYAARMDVFARIHGGGVSAQAGALRHGIARALVEADPNLRTELKRRGYLTRDPRVKERKKAGLKKARKRPQFSKR